MTVRQIIRIDEELCDGCGQCVPACAEGAIRVVDGKARLVSEIYCDGLGACLGECPQGALTVEEREVPEFDPSAVAQHLARVDDEEPARPAAPSPALHHHQGSCPGSAVRDMRPRETHLEGEDRTRSAPASRLRNWPVQIKLVPVQAPYFAGADLCIAADCVPFSHPDFHERFLTGRVLLVGCPKLDDAAFYRTKLTAIFEMQDIASVHVVVMEVPCCSGMVQLVRDAVRESSRRIPIEVTVIGIRGEEIATNPEPGREKRMGRGS